MSPLDRRSVLVAAGGLAGPALAGCLHADDGDEATPPPDGLTGAFAVQGSPLEARFETTVAVANLAVPWDIAFGPDEVYLTERPGRVRRAARSTVQGGTAVDASSLEDVPVDLPDQAAPGEGGVLGIALHPSYPDPGHGYVYYTADVGELRNRVVRFDSDRPGEVTVVLDGIPGNAIHNGGRLAFGPDDRLWILTGDAARGSLAQQPESLAGKVLRMTADGDPAGASIEGADPRVVTLGHRNLQGIDWLPDGTPITCEHGPTLRDEVNLLEESGNYGWPVARGGPGDQRYDSYSDHAEFRPPVASSETVTGWAPSGTVWYDGDAIPTLANRFLFAGLRSERLHVLTLLEPDSQTYDDASRTYDADWMDDRYRATRHELLDGEFGRLRHATAGPDGSLYLLTSNRDGRASGGFPHDRDDAVVRLDPA